MNEHINPAGEENYREEHTPDGLRTVPGCEHYTDQEAKEIITTIHRLSDLLYELTMLENAVPLYKQNHSIDFPKFDDDMNNLKTAA